MFAQITKSYCKQVRTYPTDKLMIGYKEKFKLHLLNKHKEEKKKKKGNLIETLHTIMTRLTIRWHCKNCVSKKTSYVQAK